MEGKGFEICMWALMGLTILHYNACKLFINFKCSSLHHSFSDLINTVYKEELNALIWYMLLF